MCGESTDDAVEVMLRRCSANTFDDELEAGTETEQQLILAG